MMTRGEVEAAYTVRNGIVSSPGKFEGEPAWAPYYWALVMDGCADDEESGTEPGDDLLVSVFHPDSSDVETWPELAGVTEIRLWEDDHGFVRTHLQRVRQ